ncbi:MAG TPA: hypothetical protein DD383_01350, partial [Rikenellaceae bacterium]|nr:hypothetical protein [Rikenellaceae bacterium]
MRINTSIFILAALAAVAIGCSKASAPETPFDPVVRVNPEVAPQTRGSYTTESLKEFDLFIHSENSRYSYTNTKFTKNTSGEWEPARQMLWEGKDKGFKFLAVAPPLPKRDVALALTGDIFEFTVESVQTAESKASDLLWAGQGMNNDITPSDEKYFANGKLKFQFEHALSLLKVQLTLGTELNHDGVPENNPISELKINGFKPTAKVGYGSLDISGSASEIQAYQSGWKKAEDKNHNCVATFECIVIPQEMDKFTVNFVCGGKPYTYTATLTKNGSSFSFMGGQAYTLPLTVGKDEVIMSKDGITAIPWV